MAEIIIEAKDVPADLAEFFEPIEFNTKPDTWTISTKPFKGAHFACVDEETECLTRTGWQSYVDLEKRELIASFDLASGKLSWTPLLGVSQYDVRDETMIQAGNRDLSLLLTPNHRCVVRRRTSTQSVSTEYEVVQAHLLNSRHYIPVAAEWQDNREAIELDPLLAELFWMVCNGRLDTT